MFWNDANLQKSKRTKKKKMWIWLIDLQQLSLFLSDRKHIYVSIMWLEPWGLSTFIHYTRTIHYSAQDFILFHIFCTCMMQPFAVYGGLFISISRCTEGTFTVCTRVCTKKFRFAFSRKFMLENLFHIFFLSIVKTNILAKTKILDSFYLWYLKILNLYRLLFLWNVKLYNWAYYSFGNGFFLKFTVYSRTEVTQLPLRKFPKRGKFSRKFSRKRNFLEREISQIVAKVGKFSPNFCFLRKWKKNIFVQTLYRTMELVFSEHFSHLDITPSNPWGFKTELYQ